MPQSRLRVLAFAFACDPERGSESAGGWGTVHALAEFGDVTVLMHPRHVENIQAWERAHPADNLHFHAVPTVPWGLWMQRIPALSRLSWLARYVGWLQNARNVARQLHTKQPFDVAVHVSLGMFWLPSTVVELGIPSVWGPVSGGARSPRELWTYLGRLGPLFEAAEMAAGRVLFLLPWQQRTWRRADVRLAETETVRRMLPKKLRAATYVVNRAVLTRVDDVPERPRQPYIAFTSPLERRKGPRLAITALAKTPPDVRLRMIHHGPEQPELEALARQLGVADRVEFRGKVPRDEMWKTVSEAAACLFTGLREEGGCALAEAMLVGTPVIVLDHAGAGIVAASNTDPARVARVPVADSDRTARELADAMTRFVHELTPKRSGYLDQQSAKQHLEASVREAVARHAAASAA